MTLVYIIINSPSFNFTYTIHLTFCVVAFVLKYRVYGLNWDHVLVNKSFQISWKREKLGDQEIVKFRLQYILNSYVISIIISPTDFLSSSINPVRMNFFLNFVLILQHFNSCSVSNFTISFRWRMKFAANFPHHNQYVSVFPSEMQHPRQQLGNSSSGNNFKCILSLHWNNFSRFCHLGASVSPRLINVALTKEYKTSGRVGFI